ncbi:MAG TPA: response regulator transcription factor [Trueperaceae bacterium]|nr:response regulator transcription factor [Trueperaceae bacterium]
MTIRVAIVDDHEVVRVGLASLLEDDADIRVVALAGSATDAIAAVRSSHPDVLVLDVRLPDGNGIDLVAGVKAVSPQTRVLVLTSYTGDDTIAQAVAAGVDGFASKTTDAGSLVRTIRELAAGRDVLQEQVSAALIRYLKSPPADQPPGLAEQLTSRESQIAAFVTEGLSNREIGERMGISEKTVKNHVSNVLSKMHAHRRSEIIRYFLTLRDGTGEGQA